MVRDVHVDKRGRYGKTREKAIFCTRMGWGSEITRIAHSFPHSGYAAVRTPLMDHARVSRVALEAGVEEAGEEGSAFTARPNRGARSPPWRPSRRSC